jgi:hypothetical protein
MFGLAAKARQRGERQGEGRDRAGQGGLRVNQRKEKRGACMPSWVAIGNKIFVVLASSVTHSLVLGLCSIQRPLP